MAFELQAKLLRILETGEYIKIGDTKPTRVDVRIIAATNRNLPEEIVAGRFREDLFYRLSVLRYIFHHCVNVVAILKSWRRHLSVNSQRNFLIR